MVCPTETKIMPLEGRMLDNKFRFTKLLGAGGMGAVWRAQNLRVRKAVAIKLMHPEFAGNPGILDRFRNEATAAGQIGSQHICDIFDFGTSVLGPYIVLEMLNGKSFGELIEQYGRTAPGLAAIVMRQALEGLTHDDGGEAGGGAAVLLNELAEGLAVEHLQDDVRPEHAGAEVEDVADMLAADLAGGGGFVAEAVEDAGVAGELGVHQLDRHGLADAEVLRAPHRTHAARSEQLGEAEFVVEHAALERHDLGLGGANQHILGV